MKTIILATALLLTGCATSPLNNKYNITNIETKFPDFKTLDCANKDEKQCVFWATMETLSYVEHCPAEWAKRTGAKPYDKNDLKNRTRIDNLLTNWSVYKVNDPIIHEAFNSNNVIYQQISNTTKEYLAKSTSNDAGEACLSTIEFLTQDSSTFESSDLNSLTATHINPNWIKKYQ
jgi:hypothetical protein